MLRLRKLDFLGTGATQSGKLSKRKEKEEHDNGGDREGKAIEGVEAAEACKALQALVHTSQLAEVLVRCARGKAAGADGSALRHLCVRTSTQVVRPLLSTCVKR